MLKTQPALIDCTLIGFLVGLGWVLRTYTSNWFPDDAAGWEPTWRTPTLTYLSIPPWRPLHLLLSLVVMLFPKSVTSSEKPSLITLYEVATQVTNLACFIFFSAGVTTRNYLVTIFIDLSICCLSASIKMQAPGKAGIYPWGLRTEFGMQQRLGDFFF